MGVPLNTKTAAEHLVIGVLGREGASAELSPSGRASWRVDQPTMAANLGDLEQHYYAQCNQELHFINFLLAFFKKRRIQKYQ